MRTRGGRLLVQALEDEGVRHAFGIPGTHNIELYDALDASRLVEPVLVTSEQAASFIADGVSRTSDGVGVLNLVPGAGVTHALSGVAEAFMDNVPLVVIACGIRVDTGAAYQLHAIDQKAVLEPVTKGVFSVSRAEEIYPTVRHAFQLARRAPAGPVAVEIPANLLMLTQTVSDFSWEPEPSGEERPAPDLVERAAAMVGGASLPALYVGAGAAGAADSVVRLAEKLGAPVTTTIQGKGVFPEGHPLWLWNGFGAQAPRFVRSIMDRCDCLVAIGCKFSEVGTGSYGMRPPAELIHVDVDPSVFDKNFRARLTIAADATAFVEALDGLIGGARPWRELAEAIARGHARVLKKWRSHPSRDRVSPSALFEALQHHCREDAVFATDSGNGTFLAMEHLRLRRPGRFIAPVDFSCMGYAVPAAIGAAFANPGRDIVALPGDGALLMTGMELVTATAHRAAPLVCVLRDGKLGQIAQFQHIPLNREICSALPEFSVEAFAATTGCAYFRIIRDSELDSVIPAALELTRGGSPVMIDVRVDYSRKTYFSKGAVITNFWRLPRGDRLRMVGRALARRL